MKGGLTLAINIIRESDKIKLPYKPIDNENTTTNKLTASARSLITKLSKLKKH